MKSETKIIIIISSLLFVSIITNVYLLKPSPIPDRGLYEELYNNSREQITTLQENNILIREKVDDLGDLQRQYNELQLKYTELDRERTAETETRIALEGTAREINTRMGTEISESFDIIDRFYKELETIK